MNPEPRFSIVIVHRNGPETLLAALAALHQAMDTQLDEVFLVDNASADDSIAQVRHRYPDVTIIANPCNNGFARANNQAITRAGGRFILLLNSDALVPPDILARLEGHFSARPDAALIGAALVGEDGIAQHSAHAFPSFAGELGLSRTRPAVPDPGVDLQPVDWLVGACLAARRAAVDRLGPLDEDFFFYYEDVEWSLRMRRGGWGVYLANDLPVIHLRGLSTRSLRHEARVEMVRARLLYYRKAFPFWQTAVLYLHRVLGLLLGGAIWGALALLALGRSRHLNLRALRYLYPMAWLLAGMPDGWGLPDKCPRGRV